MITTIVLQGSLLYSKYTFLQNFSLIIKPPPILDGLGLKEPGRASFSWRGRNHSTALPREGRTIQGFRGLLGHGPGFGV